MTTDRLVVRPVLIFGAPRSGTNLLRDLLTEHRAATSWPCDELNGMWKYGNEDTKHDALSPLAATTRVRTYIRRRFTALARATEVATVVEKTCANCLRVPFVAEIVPEAHVIVIERDPIDAIASILSQWRSRSASLNYLLAKARHNPVRSLPRQALSTLTRVGLMASDRNETWGPRYPTIDSDVEVQPLAAVAARQWTACVRGVRNDVMSSFPGADRITRVQYEDLVLGRPQETLGAVLENLGLDATPQFIRHATGRVHSRGVGNGRSLLSDRELEIIARELSDECLIS